MEQNVFFGVFQCYKQKFGLAENGIFGALNTALRPRPSIIYCTVYFLPVSSAGSVAGADNSRGTTGMKKKINQKIIPVSATKLNKLN